MNQDRLALTPAQQGRLDGMAANDEQARVVGWSEAYHGPVVQLSNNRQYAIVPNGRKVRLYAQKS